MKRRLAGRGVRAVGFCSVVAQVDNLGDVVIRNEMLRWLAGCCDEVYALASGVADEYLDGFDDVPKVNFVRSRIGLELRLLRAIVSRRDRPVLTFAPGPLMLRDTFRLCARSIVNLANCLVVRLSGGLVASIGRAVRDKGRFVTCIERMAMRLQNLYVARDQVTREVLGGEVIVAPDLAFGIAETSTSPQLRSTLVMSFRGDRWIDPELVGRWANLARSHGLRPLLCTQVRLDDAQHIRLAEELGLAHLAWSDRRHSAQLDRVRKAMGTAEVVVSNRLHALILGAVHGAVTLPVRDSGFDKLEASFAVLPKFEARLELDWLQEFCADAVQIDTDAARRELLDIHDRFVAMVDALRARGTDGR